MKKKLLVMLLAVVLCLCLAACGNLRPGGKYNGGMTDGNGTENTVVPHTDGMTDGTGTGTTTGRGTDARNGTVENGNGQNGVVGGYTPMPSPRATKNP